MSSSRSSSSKLPSIQEGEVHNPSTPFSARHLITTRHLKAFREAISNLSLPAGPTQTKSTVDAVEALRKAINASFRSLISLGIDQAPLRDIPSLSESAHETSLNVSALSDSLKQMQRAIEQLGQAGSRAEIDLTRDTDSDDEVEIRINLTNLVLAVEAIRKGFKNIAGTLASG